MFIDPDGISPVKIDFNSVFENDKKLQNRIQDFSGDNQIRTTFVNERNGKSVIVNDGLDDIIFVGEKDFAFATFFSNIPDFSFDDKINTKIFILELNTEHMQLKIGNIGLILPRLGENIYSGNSFCRYNTTFTCRRWARIN